MIGEITALLGLAGATTGTISGATTAVKDIKALFDKPDIDVTSAKQLISELHDKLLKAQSDHIAIKGALLDIQEEQRSTEQFQTQAARYALVQTDMGAMIYELKQTCANGEPIHYLCTTCYEKQIKSILQPEGFNALGCPSCGTQFRKSDQRSAPIYQSVKRRSLFNDF